METTKDKVNSITAVQSGKTTCKETDICIPENTDCMQQDTEKNRSKDS